MKKPVDTNMPTTVQRRYDKPDSDLGSGTAIPYSQPVMELGERGRSGMTDGPYCELRDFMQTVRPNSMTFTSTMRKR